VKTRENPAQTIIWPGAPRADEDHRWTRSSGAFWMYAVRKLKPGGHRARFRASPAARLCGERLSIGQSIAALNGRVFRDPVGRRTRRGGRSSGMGTYIGAMSLELNQ